MPLKDFRKRNKVGIIVQARMGSKRLPGKIMKLVNNKPNLFHMIKQIKKSKLYNKIIICTSKKKENNIVRTFCKQNKIICFSGSENNLVNRYYLAAKKYNIDVIVRLTADCPLIDPKIIDMCIKKFLTKNYDFVANTSPPHGKSYPDGVDVEVFSFETIKIVNNECKSRSDLEHVTPFIWRKKSRFKLFRFELKKNFSKYRFTLDYKEDFLLIKKIIINFNKNKKLITMKNVVNFLKKNKNIYFLNNKKNLFLK
jgi:spore coat polysaccharide biosynthesis protein SpsF (cytidylyltransferase family)